VLTAAGRYEINPTFGVTYSVAFWRTLLGLSVFFLTPRRKKFKTQLYFYGYALVIGFPEGGGGLG